MKINKTLLQITASVMAIGLPQTPTLPWDGWEIK